MVIAILVKFLTLASKKYKGDIPLLELNPRKRSTSNRREKKYNADI